MKKRSYFSLIVSFILLMSFWLVMSGLFDVFHIGLGVLCIALVMGIDAKLKSLKYEDDDEDVLSQIRYGYGVYYVFWLVWQIVISGIHVAGVILSPRYVNRTAIVKFKVDLPSAQARVVLGNSITLTPGTLTLDIQDNEFTVHALIPESYSGIVDDSMPRHVLRLFTTDVRQVVSDVRIYHEGDTF
jgi:multicomponent Na+:H+ antiporter subunit E